MTAPASDDNPAQSDPAPTDESSPPVTAEMLQADPRITHDVIELTEPHDPMNTFDI